MKSLLFIGSFVPNEIEQKSKYISSAANRFQNNIISVIQNKGVTVYGSSYLTTPYEDIFNEVERSRSDSEETGVIYTIKKRSRLCTCIRFLWRTKHLLDLCDNVLVYNMDYVTWWVPIISKIKRKKSFLLLADYSDETCYDSVLGKLYARIQKCVIKKYDVVIGLSERVQRFVNMSQKFLLLEGGIDKEFYDFFDEPHYSEGKKTVMYSGLLEKVTGVDNLLQAVREIEEDNLEFVFTGKGTLAAAVEELALKDSRVKYYGSVPYDEYMALLKNADILVNPRNMDMPENQNNFPSKIMEYLATGNRIVSTKFIGWEKYSDVISFSENDSCSISEMIVTTLENMNYSYEKQREFAKKHLWEQKIEGLVCEFYGSTDMN